jgi:uncharacterized protein (DUF1778 family)
MCAAPAHIIGMSVIAEERKTKRLVARVSQRDKNLLERAAAFEGRTVAAFVVNHAVARAERIIEQREVIRLNAAESRQFVEALLAPPSKPAAAARRALTEYRRRVVSHL